MRRAKQVCALMAALALTWAWSPVAMSAGLIEYGLLHGQYDAGLQPVVPAFKRNYGKYLGSGTGEIAGKISGSVIWDLYEDQSDPAVHVAQFVGQITATDHSKIYFETTGFFVPRQADQAYWDLTSSIRFYDGEGQAYRDLVGKIGFGKATFTSPAINTPTPTKFTFLAREQPPSRDRAGARRESPLNLYLLQNLCLARSSCGKR